MKAAEQSASSFSAFSGALAGAAADIRELAANEIALAKAEAKLEARRLAARVAIMFLSAMCGVVGVALLAMGLVHGLLELFPDLPLWGGYLIGGLSVMIFSWLLAFSAQELRGEKEVTSYDGP